MSEIMSDRDKISYWEQRHSEVCEERVECVSDHASVKRLTDWLNDLKRKPAIHAFTEGPERTLAYWFEKEWYERDRLKAELARLDGIASNAQSEALQLKSQLAVAREALKMMGCSELLDCEQPVMRNSKHSRRCDYAIAQEALAQLSDAGGKK